ncbi:SDR family oxidoreductase [Pelagibacteraceae bacterium]|nr:SDR family oxidoreductase [Pelagibacteraceae bacterium]
MDSNNYTSEIKKQFEGKVIIITGSTQGSGAETAKLFAARGAKAITICGRQENKGLQIKKEIEELGAKCLYIKADLSKVEDCKKIVALTDTEFGTVHSLVNVAGYTERGTILSATLENYENNFNINARAPFIIIQEAVKIMIRDKNNGTIANVLSMAMYSGMPFIVAYSGSKAALAIMTKNIANSLAGHQIRVNALNIGWTDTPAEHDIQKRVHKKGEDWLSKEENKVPYKRLTKPLDVAKGLAFMCSDESGLMTGSVIDFDQTVNGWHSYSAYDTKILDESLLGE